LRSAILLKRTLCAAAAAAADVATVAVAAAAAAAAAVAPPSYGLRFLIKNIAPASDSNALPIVQ